MSNSAFKSLDKIDLIPHRLKRNFNPGLRLTFALGLCFCVIIYSYAKELVFVSTDEMLQNTDQMKEFTESVNSIPTVQLEPPNRAPFDFEQIVEIHKLARAFPPPKEKNVWCTKSYNQSEPTGLIYVKVEKAASSTTAGVALRIAHRVGGATNANNTLFNDPCDVHYEHTHSYRHISSRHNAAGKFYGNRNVNKSFMFASIRDPSSRAISRIFFENVSHQKGLPTDENIIKWLKRSKHIFSPGRGGFQLAYTSLEHIKASDAWSVREP